MEPPLPRPLLTEEQIIARVAELASAISHDYAGEGEIVLVGVLKGAFIFLADLARRLTIPRRVDFIALSTYSDQATDPAAVRLIMDLRIDIAGRHVLVVEDIVDTGHTLTYLQRILAARRPASLKTCVLLHKPTRRQVEITPDYLGFEIPDRWVVGYGLDHADHHRTLPYIGLIET
ncbi:MAG: hypoxanthine phosphoribosyltransferase [Nitrospirota bacterium]|jgi:hypoxanthine phosphoribosyltransferase